MLRVKENTDGTYSPIDHAKYSSPLQQGGVAETERRAPAGDRPAAPPAPLAPQGADNVLTHAKMADLRRRMDTLSLLRHNRKHATADMHKTRSEETLPVSASDAACGTYSRNYTFDEDSFAPLYDGNFTRYEYDCSFADRYTLLPPIGTRTDSEQSVGEGSTSELAASVLRKESSTTELAASVLRKEGRDRRRREPDTLAPISTDLGAVVGPGVEWRSSGAGGGHSASASSLRLAAAGGAEPASAPRAPLASYYSSSTSDLHSTHRLLPALSRHRNRSHLHLSDESLPAVTPVAPVDAPTEPTPAPAAARAKRERCCRCRKRLGAATLLRCRCGAACCAEHRYPDTHACRLYPPKPARPL